LLKSMDLKSLEGLQDMFPVLEQLYIHGFRQCRQGGSSCGFSEIHCVIDPPSLPCSHPHKRSS
jgi:hypothetical protein